MSNHLFVVVKGDDFKSWLVCYVAWLLQTTLLLLLLSLQRINKQKCARRADPCDVVILYLSSARARYTRYVVVFIAIFSHHSDRVISITVRYHFIEIKLFNYYSIFVNRLVECSVLFDWCVYFYTKVTLEFCVMSPQEGPENKHVAEIIQIWFCALLISCLLLKYFL